MEAAIQKIPIVDIGPLINQNSNKEVLDKTVSDIGYACKNVGFFYVENHGIPKEHLVNVFKAIKEFFELSVDEKNKIHMSNSEIFRGYTPLGNEVTNDQRDWNEAVDFGLDLDDDHPDVITQKPLQGPNQWPERPSNFKEIMKGHWEMLINLGTRVTEGLSLSLGLDRHYFKSLTDKDQSAMRILHYPPSELKEEGDYGEGIGAHIDYGFLTILAQDQVGGLEVKNSAGEWIPAPFIPGTFVINIGHMMQRWTNDYYKATFHRVKSQPGKHRYSFPFFYEPNYDTVVTPLKEFCTDDNPSQYEPFHFGEYLYNKYVGSYANNSNV